MSNVKHHSTLLRTDLFPFPDTAAIKELRAQLNERDAQIAALQENAAAMEALKTKTERADDHKKRVAALEQLLKRTTLARD